MLSLVKRKEYCNWQLTRAVLLFVLLIKSSFLVAQSGVPLIENYAYNQFNKQTNSFSSPQFFDVTQDNLGVLYFANSLSLLEFAGTDWKYIRLPLSQIKAVEFSDAGTLYVGAINEFGKMTRNSTGELRYSSLNPREIPLGTVRRITPDKEDVYFFGDSVLYCVQADSLIRLRKFSLDATLHKTETGLYVAQPGEGLYQLKGTSIIPYSALPIFKENIIPFIMDLGEGKMLIGTIRNGVFLLERDEVSPFLNPGMNRRLKEARIRTGLKLSDGSIAIGTEQNGVFIFTSGGEPIFNLNMKSGLKSNFVHTMEADLENNLWVTFNDGISKIKYPFPITQVKFEDGYEGIILDINRFKDKLYFSTTQSVYRLRSDEEMLTSDSYLSPVVSIQNILSWNFNLVNAGGCLLVPSDDGVYQIENDQAKPIFKQENYPLYLSKSKDGETVYVGTSGGVVRLSKEIKGKCSWRYDGEIGLGWQVHMAALDEEGSLWVSSGAGPELLRIQPAEVFSESQMQRFDSTHFPAGASSSIELMRLDDKLYFGSWNGLMKFDKEQGEFQPDYFLGERFAAGKPWDYQVYRMSRDLYNNVYVSSGNYKYLVTESPGQQWELDSLLFFYTLDYQARCLFSDGDGTSWMGTEAGLFRVNPRIRMKYDQPFYSLIRKVVIGQDSILFDGSWTRDGEGPGNHRYLLEMPVLGHTHNNISFNFAAATFEDPKRIMFSYKLEGWDREWSNWSKRTEKEYTNLDAGDYLFQVKSHNIYGTESVIAEFPFRVLPPFYKTWWFYGLQGGVIVLLFILSIVIGREGKTRKIALAIATVAIFLVFEYIHSYIEANFEDLMGSILTLKILANVFVALMLLPLEKVVTRLMVPDKKKKKTHLRE